MNAIDYDSGLSNGDEWVLVDTETNGIKTPIICVEIAAQKMRGYEPVGEPFSMYIYEGEKFSMSRDATKINGITKRFLMENGEPPFAVWSAFRSWLGRADLPLASYNLEFDYDKVLVPAWERARVGRICTRGFCILSLMREYLISTRGYSLAELGDKYHLYEDGEQAHSALADVRACARLLALCKEELAKRGDSFFEMQSVETLQRGKRKLEHERLRAERAKYIPPTKKQIDYLRALGSLDTPKSMADASKKITSLKAESAENEGCATNICIALAILAFLFFLMVFIFK